MTIHESILSAIKDFESAPAEKITSEDTILSKIRNKVSQEATLDKFSNAELIAFHMLENSDHGQTKWRTYFGPITGYNPDNTISESVSLDDITDEVIQYWEERLKDSINPVIKARYAGLLWVFKGKVTNLKPDLETIGKVYIENLIKSVCEGYFHYSHTNYIKLRRAAELSSTLKLSDLKMFAVHAILDYEDRNSKINRPGTWLKSFEILIDNKNIPITLELDTQIIEKAEVNYANCLKLNSEGKYELDSAHEAAGVLLQHYRKRKKDYEVERVLTSLHETYDKVIATADSFKSIVLLEKLNQHVKKFGTTTQRNFMLRRLREKEPELYKHMKAVPFAFKIDKDKLITYSDGILNGPLDAVFQKLAISTIPHSDDIFDQQKSISGIMNLVSKTLHDDEGRKLSSIGSIDTDPKGNQFMLVARSLLFSGIFLKDVIRKGKERGIFTVPNIMSYLRGAKAINPGRYKIIELGLTAYLKRDYVTCMHLLIPQIEAASLNLLDLHNGVVRKEGKNAGMSVRTFDSVLCDEEFIKIITENTSTYFRTVLTSDQGWNLRNIVCHGLSSDQTFNSTHADRIFSILLYFGLFTD
jgi:hypothetical protein